MLGSQLKSPVWDDPPPSDGAFLEPGQRVPLYPKYAKAPNLTGQALLNWTWVAGMPRVSRVVRIPGNTQMDL